MRTKEIGNEDLGLAMNEMKDSATNLLSSMGHLVTQINWKSVAPKLIIGLIVLYGVRNHRMIRSLVASMAVSKVSDEIMSRMKAANA